MVGTPVTTVLAVDHDDPTEGGNARIVYSLQKNVVDEESGRPIFAVESDTGRLLTALCCLDRERTDAYAVQVVATDGGGLKGTGTVLVKVSDENDVPPKFSRNEWHLNVDEEKPLDLAIASLSVIDPDISNDFRYRIVYMSGKGWDLFYLSPGNSTESFIHSKIRLDYENRDHREGFRFQIQVSDWGSDNWEDKYHIDSAWVNIRLRDINDNGPQFVKEAHYRRVSEDIPLGSPLVTVKARDADGGGGSPLDYTIDPRSDPANLFAADRTGAIRLRRPLDRETANSHRLLILATDQGEPARNATATLVVDVIDVNDNAPFFNCPTFITIDEGSPPQTVANLTLDDPDDWTKGHGPPFSLILDPHAPTHIKESVSVQFDRDANDGIGLGLVRTITRLDREERRSLTLPIIVADSGVGTERQSATLTFTIALQDINDHRMMSATKQVTAWLLQSTLSSPRKNSPGRMSENRVPLGQVFVLDPDDDDSRDKRFHWGHPSPHFTMDPDNGNVFMEPWTPTGTYLLQFLVTDYRQGQSDVSANMTVEVRVLGASDLRSSVPIDVEASAERLIRRDKSFSGSSPLDALTRAIDIWVESLLEGRQTMHRDSSSPAIQKQRVSSVALKSLQSPSMHPGTEVKSRMGPPAHHLRIWITSPASLNLEHLMLRHQEEMEELLGAPIWQIGSGKCQEVEDCSSGCWVRPEVGKGYTLVDAQSSSVVGPDLYLASGCGCNPPEISAGDTNPVEPRPVVKAMEDNICDGEICLNGGRCIPQLGAFRCICPHGTIGPRCKMPQRFFFGDSDAVGDIKDAYAHDGFRLFEEQYETGSSWVWAPALPSCAQVHITLEFLTTRPNGVLLFSGESIPMSASMVPKYKRTKRENIFKRNKKELSIRSKQPGSAFEEVSAIKESFLPWNLQLTENPVRNTSSSRLYEITPLNSAIWETPSAFEVMLPKRKKRATDLLPENSLSKRHRPTDELRQIRHKRSNPLKRTSDNQLHEDRRFYDLSQTSTSENVLLMSELQEDKDNSKENSIFPEIEHFSDLRPDFPTGNLDNPSLSSNERWKQLPKSTSLRRKKSHGSKSSEGDRDFLLLRLIEGKPHLLLNLGGGDIALSLSSSAPLSDLHWHRIDIVWKDQLLEMIVDLCLGGSIDTISHPLPSWTPPPTTPDAFHCKVAAPLPKGGRLFNFSGPVQLGGLSPTRGSLRKVGSVPKSSRSGGTQHVSDFDSFRGCVRNFRVNGELQDLGYGLLGWRSVPGCLSMDCREVRRRCADRGLCVGAPGNERCECRPGLVGHECQEKTVPAAFGEGSFVTLALSFTPLSSSTTIQFRLKSREEYGELVSLSSPHGKDRLSLFLDGGNLCLHLRLHPEIPSVLCLSKFKVNDGEWHRIEALRVGSAMALMVDDGDSNRYNTSLLLDGRRSLPLSRQDGVKVGGSPIFSQGRVVTVESDFKKGCIDDLRLQGRTLPLPPGTNGTRWGQVTSFHHVTEGCQSSGACSNVTCPFSLSCIDTWDLYHCGCESGFSVALDSQSCIDIDECKWRPCLNDGLCRNSAPGYTCSCPAGFSGFHCNVREGKAIGPSPPWPLFFAVALSTLLLLLGIMCGFAYHQRRSRRRKCPPNKEQRPSDSPLRCEAPNRQKELASFHLSCGQTTMATRSSPNASRNIGDVDVLKVDLRTIKDSTRCGQGGRNQETSTRSLMTVKSKRTSSSELDVINTYKEN